MLPGTNMEVVTALVSVSLYVIVCLSIVWVTVLLFGSLCVCGGEGSRIVNRTLACSAEERSSISIASVRLTSMPTSFGKRRRLLIKLKVASLPHSDIRLM